jgi:heat-inducible transcriptional repressor
MPTLDSRKEQVLKAVVDDYTETAVPVGSHTLAHRYFAEWSSATIRNELAYLMETGHLRQPHTSSGRMPSDLGYRYFVDYLMEEVQLDPHVRTRLQRFFDSLPADIEAILEGTAMILSQMGDSIGIVTAPRTRECKLKHLDLVQLEGKRILAIIVLEGNLVRQQPLVLADDVGQEELGELAGRLNTGVRMKSAAELRAYARKQKLTGWRLSVVDGVADFMAAYDSHSSTFVVHDGVRNLVKHPEFTDREHLLPVLEPAPPGVQPAHDQLRDSGPASRHAGNDRAHADAICRGHRRVTFCLAARRGSYLPDL